MAGRNKLCFLVFLGLFCFIDSLRLNQTKSFQRLRQQDLSEEKMSSSCLCLEESCGKILKYVPSIFSKILNLVYLCLTAKKPTIFAKQETFRKSLQVGNRKSFRIVNGFDTEGPLPYQLRIKARVSFLKVANCGGILISSRFGITADHCIDDTKYLKEAKVWAGAYKNPAISPEGSVRNLCFILKTFKVSQHKSPEKKTLSLEGPDSTLQSLTGKYRGFSS